MKHPFDIIYSPNSCETHADSFFHPTNDHLTSEEASKDLSICFLNFDASYERLSDITLVQTFNWTHLSNAELDRLSPKIHEIRQVTFEWVNQMLQGINETCPFAMPGWWTITIFIVETWVLFILYGSVYYLKYRKA